MTRLLLLRQFIFFKSNSIIFLFFSFNPPQPSFTHGKTAVSIEFCMVYLHKREGGGGLASVHTVNEL